jgi:YbbR domain-containing protein
MSLLERLRNNLSLKLLSLAMAFVIWGTVHNQANPLETRSLSVRVAPLKVPADLAVVSIDPTQVTVTLAGRSSSFHDLEFSTFKLAVDLTNGQVGSQTLPLQPSNLPKGLEVRRLARNTARVELDTVVVVNRPVFVETRGHAADGFAAQGWQVRPNEVEVSGPSSVVQRVSRVVAELDISGRTATFESQVTLVARDASNLQVAEVALKPPHVEVTVPIRQVNSRTVSLVPVLGNPPAGYEVASVSVTPTVVTLTGNAEALGGVESVSTATVDISQLTGRNTFSVSLQVPAGLSVLGSRSARVTVAVRPGKSFTGGRTETPGESEPEAGRTPANPRPREGQPAGERPGGTGSATAPAREPEGSEASPPETEADNRPRSSLRTNPWPRTTRPRPPASGETPAEGN